MGEIKLKVGERKIIKNQYGPTIYLLKKEDGYYVNYERITLGPFMKLMSESIGNKKNKERILVCVNPGKSEYYRIQYDGLKHLDSEDWLYSFSEELNQKVSVKKEIIQQDSNCVFLGKVSGYSIFVDANDKFFAVDNSKKVKSLDEYMRFDTYMDLVYYFHGEKDIKLHNTDIKVLTEHPYFFFDIEDLKNNIDKLNYEDLTKEEIDFFGSYQFYKMIEENPQIIDKLEVEIKSIWKKLINRCQIAEIKKYRVDSNGLKELEKEGKLLLAQNRSFYIFNKRYPEYANELFLMIKDKAKSLIKSKISNKR